MSQFKNLMQFAQETANPNFSLSVPQQAKTVIRELVQIVENVHSLTMSTDGKYLDGSDFGGLIGEVQRVLRDGGVILPEATDSRNEGETT